MRQMISGLVAAIAVVTASAAPAMACGWYGCCALCGPQAVRAYVSPATPPYGLQLFGCGSACGWAYERLPDPVQQYYYVNQGPTYTGPGQLRAVSDLSGRRYYGCRTAIGSYRALLSRARYRTRDALSRGAACCAATTDRRID